MLLGILFICCMEVLIVIVLGLCLLAFRVMRFGDYFSPWFLTIGVWFVILLLFQTSGDLLYPLGDRFYTSLSIWLPIFCISSILTYLSLPGQGKGFTEQQLRDIPFNSHLFYTLFAISMVITPIYLYRVMQLVSQFDMDNVFFNLRILAVYGNNQLGFLQYSYVLNQVLLVVAILQYKHIRWWVLIMIIIANLAGQFAIMEKSGIFFMIIATIIILYEKHAIKTRTIVTVMLVLVAVFYVVNKAIEGFIGSDGMTFLDFFGIYVMSPPVAFEYVQPDLSHDFGSNTFSYFYLFLNRFGITNVEIIDRLQEYVMVPLPTNVYTIFEPFYKDWGYAGIAFFAFVYGVITACVYRFFRNGGIVAMCIYIYFARFLIMQFYHEDFLRNFVLFLQFSFFSYILLQRKVFLTFKPLKCSDA